MLEDQMMNDYVKAMKDKDTVRSSVLSFLRAQVKNVRIDKKAEKLDDADVIAVVKKQIKQRQDSIEQFEKGGRMDLAQKEKQEMEILKSYLPPEMSAAELKNIIAQAIQESGAAGSKDMGKVMKVLMPKVAGKADSKLVSDLVKEKLSHL